MNAEILSMVIMVLIIFLVGRLFVLWYFKINKKVEQNDEIISLLRSINSKLNK